MISSTCWEQEPRALPSKRLKALPNQGSPALSMIPGRQQSWRPWFPWGFSLAPSRKRAAFIRSAREPESEIGPISFFVSFSREVLRKAVSFFVSLLREAVRRTVLFFFLVRSRCTLAKALSRSCRGGSPIGGGRRGNELTFERYHPRQVEEKALSGTVLADDKPNARSSLFDPLEIIRSLNQHLVTNISTQENRCPENVNRLRKDTGVSSSCKPKRPQPGARPGSNSTKRSTSLSRRKS